MNKFEIPSDLVTREKSLGKEYKKKYNESQEKLKEDTKDICGEMLKIHETRKSLQSTLIQFLKSLKKKQSIKLKLNGSNEEPFETKFLSFKENGTHPQIETDINFGGGNVHYPIIMIESIEII